MVGAVQPSLLFLLRARALLTFLHVAAARFPARPLRLHVISCVGGAFSSLAHLRSKRRSRLRLQGFRLPISDDSVPVVWQVAASLLLQQGWRRGRSATVFPVQQTLVAVVAAVRQ